MVDAMFIFILFFLSRLTFVQFGFHSVVSTYAWFILFYCVTSLGSTHFSIMFIPHCKYFFLSSCTRNMAHSHNAVNTHSQSLLHRKYTCTRPVRQMPFRVKRLKIEEHHRRQQRALRPILSVKCTHQPDGATTNNRCSALTKDPVLAFDSGMAALSF